jgi:hypothetical protein
MSERPDFLNQPARLRKQDRELQTKLRANALGEELAQQILTLPSIESSIAQIEKELQLLPKEASEARANLEEQLSALCAQRNEQQNLRTKMLSGKPARDLEFIERSIVETKRALRETDNAGRAGLKGRLTFLRQERERLLS